MSAQTRDQTNQKALEHLVAGRIPQADALARQVLAEDPNDAPALHCLGMIAQKFGRHTEAVQLISRAINSDPGIADYHYNLSVSLTAVGMVDRAIFTLRQTLLLRPELAPAHLNLGVLLMDQGNAAEAEQCFRAAARFQPGNPGPHINLGKLLRSQDQLDRAEAEFREAISLAPNLSLAWNMLGSCLRETGRIGEAVAAFRQAVQLNPQYREAHSNLCYALHFDPLTPPAQMLAEHRAWAAKFAGPVDTMARPHVNDRNPDRRLRIAYLSPNLRTHVVGFFMEPVLRHHDWENVDLVCYSDAPKEDDFSTRLKAYVPTWRQTHSLSDETLAKLVREDGVDILVDLNLHMRGCRLRVFAQKPAPVQITHLAYCGTSGLTQMDWCVCDPHMIAPGCERYFAEKLLPLADCYWCYRPPAGAPEVGPAPVQKNGFVTFGSLNSLAKVNDNVLQVWTKLLERVPRSRLALHAPGGQSNPSIVRRLVSQGIPVDRLLLYPRLDLIGYLKLYNQIDIALDPFPYGGGTTTFDALWMGVPVVTLEGTMPLGRAGASILRNLGFPDLITSSPEAFLARVTDLSGDPTALAQLRTSLRDRLAASLLLDAPRYVRNLEAAYRRAWQSWCDKA
jgi:predicted O-linked N-acetylglucosamine transferase (SPINDLY family)